MNPETPFAALPVRQRGTLEIIDTALKLFRRYAGVLLGWSALVSALLLLGTMVPFGALLAYPLSVGSCACCIAAAVRGQRMTFGQVWDFTKPRYGALLLITFLNSLIIGATMIPLFVIFWLTYIFFAYLFIAGLLAIIPVLLVSNLLVYIYTFLSLIPIIACLEDDKRGTDAMGRAWELMKGSWRRVIGLSTLLTLAILAVMGIVGGTLALVGESLRAFDAGASDTALVALVLTGSGFFALFFLFWNPIQTLILAVLYLDLRVRKEALDLEWSSYNSAPVGDKAAETALLAPDLAHQNTQIPFDDDAPASLSPFVENSASDVSPSGVVSPAQLRPPAPQQPAPQQIVDAAETVSLLKPPTPEPFDFSSSFSAGAAPIAPHENENEDEKPNAS